MIDDLESTDPWRPRGIEVRWRAEAIPLPTSLIRIHPERIISWGLESGRSARTVASYDPRQRSSFLPPDAMTMASAITFGGPRPPS